MPRKNGRQRGRFRVGRVSVYLHHGAWWVYYRDAGRQIRRKVANERSEAERIAAQINSQIASGAPTLLSFTPIGVPELRRAFLDYHENVLNSTVSTVRRYRAATQHLENFAGRQGRALQAHQLNAAEFLRYLRQLEVAPNGHPHALTRRLRHKGIQFVAETCRSLYAFAGKHRHLPPYTDNPFVELPIDRMRIEDAKPIFVFDAVSEVQFLRAADSWEFPLHFTLAKTGLRIGELTHLLIEDLDIASQWLHVRNKIAIGWRVKTGCERSVPMLPELARLLSHLIGSRKTGPVFLRRRFSAGCRPPLVGDRNHLELVVRDRRRANGSNNSRTVDDQIAYTIWRDAGAVKSDSIRQSFIRIMRSLGRPDVTCPKFWRHTFATLLQDANVDPLIRQITLGHQPTGGGLGMTANYTHTRPETQRSQIESALRRWPESLALANTFTEGALR